MELYSDNEHYKLYHWNMLDLWEVIESWTIDSIVTDPPYELNFMGKGWDNSGIAFQPDTWKKCYDALKPWGYLLAFGGSRTFHRIACAIEDAGFEIRDTIMWLYGSWFPKSMDIEKAINKRDGVEFTSKPASWVWFMNNKDDGYHNTLNQLEQVGESSETALKRAWWGTALKPSYEPIIVARKPLEWSCTDNVIKYGVGGINIDECRVGTEEKTYTIKENWFWDNFMDDNRKPSWKEYEKTVTGRFPANTILTYDESDFDEVCLWFPKTKIRFEERNDKHDFKGNKEAFTYWYKKRIGSWFNDEWSASRYFYCAKASKRDRDEWLDGFDDKSGGTFQFRQDGSLDWKVPQRKNTHPTVKPTDLMQYLVRLVTPKWWTVLDPFNWSGSTWKAVMYENKDRHKNYKYIWIELTDEYLPIAKARIEYVINKVEEKPELPYEQPLF